MKVTRRDTPFYGHGWQIKDYQSARRYRWIEEAQRESKFRPALYAVAAAAVMGLVWWLIQGVL